jgi:hypothetical protein
MSFQRFIYYCAICGGLAAWLTFAMVMGASLRSFENRILQSALIGSLLGLLVSGALGLLDAVMNSVGFQRLLRVMVCVGVGLIGGMVGGMVGEALFQTVYRMQPDNIILQAVMHVIGWTIVGLGCGISIGVYDILQAATGAGSVSAAINKVRNGIAGGLLGGIVGGAFFALLADTEVVRLPRFPLALGLTIVGLCIGLFIGLAQVILKEAWIKVESGFRAGRELILAKQETAVGRGEGCDVGLFGDPQVEKLHARIVQKNNRYFVEDVSTSSGTYVNDQRVSHAAPAEVRRRHPRGQMRAAARRAAEEITLLPSPLGERGRCRRKKTEESHAASDPLPALPRRSRFRTTPVASRSSVPHARRSSWSPAHPLPWRQRRRGRRRREALPPGPDPPHLPPRHSDRRHR